MNGYRMQYQQVNNMHNNNNHGQRPVRFEHQVQVPMHHPRFGAQMPPQYFAQRPVNINSHYPRSGAQMPARFSVQPPMVINGHYPRSGAQMAPRFLAYQRPMAPQFGALQPVSGRVCRPIGRQGYIRPRPNAIPIVDPATIAQCPEINVSEKVQEKVEILQAKNETVPQHVEALQDETDLRTKDNTIPKKAETPKTIQKWTIQTKRVKAYDCVKPISNKQSKQKLDWSRNSRRWNNDSPDGQKVILDAASYDVNNKADLIDFGTNVLQENAKKRKESGKDIIRYSGVNLWELHKPDTHMSPCHDPKRYEYFRPEFQDLERLNYWGVHVEKTIVSTFNKLAPSTMSLHLEELRTLHIHTNIQLELFVDKFGTACIYNGFFIRIFAQTMFQFAQSLEHENLKVILPSLLTNLFFKELKEKIDLMLSFCATRDVTMSPERMEDWNVEESRIKTRASNCAIAMGELYVANMMDREQILEAIDILLEKPRLSCETVEITMKVLEKIGATLEKYDGTNLEKMFIYLRNLMDGEENVIEPDNVRMKFLYYDLLDLRRSGWMELEKKVVPTAEPAPNQGPRRRVFSTAITVNKINALLKELKVNKNKEEFCREIEQMEITTEALLKVTEANLELGNERQVVLLIGQLLRNDIISLDVFWDELVLPLFEIIDELVLDMPFVISSFVVFFGKLIKQAEVFSLEDLELVVKKCSNKTLDRLPIELKAKFAADDLKKEQSNEEVVNAEVNVVQPGKIEAEKKNSEEVTHQALATSRAEPKLDLEKEAMKRNVAARLKEEKQKRHNEEIRLKAAQEKQKKHNEEIRLKAVQEKEKSRNEEIRLKTAQEKQKSHNEEISLKASQEKQKKHDEEIRLKAVQEKEKSQNEEIRLKAVQDAIISRESNRGKGQNQNHQQQPQNKFGNKKKNKKKQKKR